MKIIVIFFLLASTVNVYANESIKKEKTSWQIGLGVGGVSLPHYRGSDQRSNYISPIPYLRYNGNRLKVDREGGRYDFYDDKDLRVDVSLAFSLAVDSEDNRARVGMFDLANIIEVGPRIQYKLYESKDNNLRLRFALPLRVAFATDFNNTEHIGVVFAPYLQLRYFNTGWESAFSLGPVWASEKYHKYFYDVDSQYVTVARPVYSAKSGYSGSRFTFSLSKRFEKIYFGLFVKYDYLNGAAFINSPLVKQNDSVIVGAALSWVFKKSDK